MSVVSVLVLGEKELEISQLLTSLSLQLIECSSAAELLQPYNQSVAGIVFPARYVDEVLKNAKSNPHLETLPLVCVCENDPSQMLSLVAIGCEPLVKPITLNALRYVLSPIISTFNYENREAAERIDRVDILVVDDEQVSRDLIIAACQNVGCSVETVGDFEEGFWKTVKLARCLIYIFR